MDWRLEIPSAPGGELSKELANQRTPRTPEFV